MRDDRRNANASAHQVIFTGKLLTLRCTDGALFVALASSLSHSVVCDVFVCARIDSIRHIVSLQFDHLFEQEREQQAPPLTIKHIRENTIFVVVVPCMRSVTQLSRSFRFPSALLTRSGLLFVSVF